MMTLEQISAALKDRRLEIVAQATGLHYNTLRTIRDKPDEANPTWKVITLLSDYFKGRRASD